jgi:uncharacterized repeat protein (TIGR01451 family)
MSDDAPTLSRRRILQAVGASGAAALAGCSGGDPTATPTDRPTATPTETPDDDRPCPDAEYVLNTGYDQSSGSTIGPCSSDDDWEITHEDVIHGPAPRPADVINADPGWAGPFPDSRWVSVACGGGSGLTQNTEAFEYTYCFCLNEGFSQPELELRMRADDAIEDIRLNGNSLPFSGTGSFSGPPIEEHYGQRYRRFFQAGENCLTIVVRDTAAVVTGLNLVGTVTAKNGECCRGSCDLDVEKTHEGAFEFGETGTYVLEVCNAGDGDCERAVELEDELPAGVDFEAASGPDWNVSLNNGTLKATHPNPNGLAPDECLPPLRIDVSVYPFEEFPAENGVSNCAELLTGGAEPHNDRDCTRPCVEGEHTFEAGVRDGFDTGNAEPAVPSQGIQARWPGPFREFDESGVNAHFGHTFDGLRPSREVGDICAAELEICLRPEGSSLDSNDRINIGVWDDDGSELGRWSRYLGNHDGSPGVFDTQWDADDTGTRCLTLDLSALPEADGSTTDLLPVLNSHDRLDIHVQDDTAVDFATLTVQYCCAGDGGEPTGECDLSVRKTAEGEFHLGETGQYRIEVCNDGEGHCEGPLEVTDSLADGMVLSGDAGVGWNCQQQGGAVVCRHDNPGGLAPGDCLPALTLEVDLPGPEKWPGSDAAKNCVQLDHDGAAVDEDCVRHPVVGHEGDCELAVEKRVAERFEYGETGTYAFEVCNIGDGDCNEEFVEIVDDLPEGMTFTGSEGAGWTVDSTDADTNRIRARYDGVALEAGECLPVLHIEVAVADADAWPGGDTAKNCAELSTPEGPTDEDCIEHRIG